MGSKLVLLADVVLGKVEEKDDVICSPLTKGYNSVRFLIFLTFSNLR